MLVKDCMTRHPILITPTMRAAEAQKLMGENNIRHLPVVGDGKRLVGLLTRERLALKPDVLGSLNVWEISRYLAELSVEKVMLPARHVQTIDQERTVERAAHLMTEEKLGCLPVIEEGIVVGILTETDLLSSYQEMLGLPAEGVRVTMRMPDKEGEFTKLMKVIVDQKWGIMGIGTFPTPRLPGQYDMVLKIVNVTVDDVRETLSGVPGQAMVDIRDVV